MSQLATAGKAAPDNPDQRITTDLILFALSLRRVLSEFGTAPFKILFYSWWTWSYTGWLAVVIVYTFAIVGAALQRSGRLPNHLLKWFCRPLGSELSVNMLLHGLCRLPASRIAALVFRQERLEGDLRSAHVRLRAWAVEIALVSRGPAEADALERPLAAALRNLRRIIDTGWLLSVSTHALGYAGALLNYSCIALAMLHGARPRCSTSHVLRLRWPYWHARRMLCR